MEFLLGGLLYNKNLNMKTKSFVLIALAIVLLAYLSFNFSKPIKFQLIEAKTNAPLTNKEIEIYYVDFVFDAPGNLELIEKLTTDHVGNFELKLSRGILNSCLLYTSPSPRDATLSRMPSSA